MAGSWCPEWSSGLSERLCRTIVEQIFKKPFPRIRPTWLINPKTGCKLELDGYNEELGLAFEYQGEQHYSPERFHESNTNIIYEDQVERDKVKLEKCEENKIKLVVIPPITTLSRRDLPLYIFNEFKKLGVLDITENNLKNLDMSNAYVSLPTSLDKIIRNIEVSGGKIIKFDNLVGKITIECFKGHQRTIGQQGVLSGTFGCKECSGKQTLTIEIAQEAAAKKKGKCLSTEYKNCYTNLIWECQEGHQWKAGLKSIRNGHWCKSCNIKKAFAKRKLLNSEKL